MQDIVKQGSTSARGQRVVLPARLNATAEDRAGQGAQRMRRGSQTAAQAVWRRTEMGTNPIACFGVWRRGTRRQAERLNRSGTTRWHLPHRGGAMIVLSGARHEAVNED